MYSYDAVPDAVEQVAELPVHALPSYAELIAFLELTHGKALPIARTSRRAACGRCPLASELREWLSTSSSPVSSFRSAQAYYISYFS